MAYVEGNIGLHDRQSLQAPGAWDQVETQIPPSQSPKNDTELVVVERAAKRLYLSTQYTSTVAVKLVSGRVGRAWVMLVNSGSTAVMLSESDSNLDSAVPQGFLLPVGASVTLPCESTIWGISTAGNSTVSIAVGEN